MALDPKDQALFVRLTQHVLHLEHVTYALAYILKTKTGVTDQEIQEALMVARAARDEFRERANESPEETLLRSLLEFQGPKQ
jgi:hypothetical protein